MFDEEKTRRKLIAKYLNKKRVFKNLIYSILKHKGIYISHDAAIDEKVFFVHPYNIFIGKGIIISDNSIIGGVPARIIKK